MERFFLAPYADAPADWLETPSAHVFRVDLPGVSKKDVQVNIHEDNILEITGEHKKLVEKSPTIWHLVERSQGRCVRRFQLPDDARVDDVKAVIEDGVLTVSVPKKPLAKSVAKKIPIVSKL